ncbi:outer membrane protein assembly factor BamB family protein [Poriferisphaera corsica]|uniref:outer membrane protein assembly factor BamB family protein n=1 Tax=Poriferisphaera corsica TaxID=2528020 RepID=UPI00190B4921|nr:PQQ-binding-like beta-propeller repeat protein [Poriferisphaera corsica]
MVWILGLKPRIFFSIIILTAILIYAQFLNAAPIRPVYVEDSPAAMELVQQFQDDLNADHFTRAAQSLQKLIEDYPSKLMTTDTDAYRDSIFYAYKQLRQTPELYETYIRLYEPDAQKAYEEVNRQQQIKAYEQLLSRFGFTQAGLESALDVTAMHLERAEIQRAVRILEFAKSHPLVQQSQNRVMQMQAAVSALPEIYSSDGSEIAKTIAPAMIKQLIGDGQTPLWETNINDKQHALSNHEVQQSQWAVNRIALQQALPHRGVLVGNQIIVNFGQSIVSLDRYSGRRQWSFHYTPELSEATKFTLKRGRVLLDTRDIIYNQSHIFGVVGRAPAWASRRQDEGHVTSLVSINIADGQLAWQLKPSDLADIGLDRAYLHSTPILQDNILYQIAERRPATGFQDTYVLAINATTGQLLWKRHIASTARINRNSIDLVSRMSLSNGYLYVSDYAGVVASLNIRNGSVQWLRILDRKNAMTRRLGGNSGTSIIKMPPPIVVGDKLFVLPDRRVSSGLILDRKTGKVSQKLPDERWRNIRQIFQYKQNLILVSQQNIYSYNVNSNEFDWDVSITESGVNVLLGGFVHIQDQLLVSLSNQMIVVNLDDGQLVSRYHPINTGQIMIDKSQIIINDADSVRSYMRWSDAESRLVQALSDSGVEPGLAMAHIGINHNKAYLINRGLDHVMKYMESLLKQQKIEQYSQNQAIVFNELFQMATDSFVKSNKIKQTLFDNMSTIVQGSKQEMRYHFAAGQYMAQQKNYLKAVEHYQSILINKELSSARYISSSLSRTAYIEASMRIQQIIDQVGLRVYQSYDHIADLRLKELLKSENWQSEQMLDLVHRYPFSNAAIVSLYHLAKNHRQNGEQILAHEYFEEAIEYLQPTHSIRGKLIPRLIADYYSSSLVVGKLSQAKIRLEQILQQRPKQTIMRNNSLMRLDVFVRKIAQSSHQTRDGLTVPVSHLATMTGTYIHAVNNQRSEYFYLQTNSSISRIHQSSEKPAWTTKINNGYVNKIVEQSKVDLLLQSSSHGRLYMLRPNDGHIRWTFNTQGKLKNQTEPIQVDFDPREKESSWHDAVMLNNIIILADKVNHVYAIDAGNGKLIWNKQFPLDQIHQVQMFEQKILITGLQRNENGKDVGIITINNQNGDVINTLYNFKSRYLWHQYTQDKLIIVYRNSIEVLELQSKQPIWTAMHDEIDLTKNAWYLDGHLIVLDDDGIMHVYNTDNGETLSRISIDSLGFNRRVDVQYLEGRWYIMAGSRALAIDWRGNIVWRDTVVMPGRKIFASQAITNRYIVYLSAQLNANDFWERDPSRIDLDQEQGYKYRLYFLDNKTGKLQYIYRLPALNKPLITEHFTLIGNRILLRNKNETLVLGPDISQ